MSNKKRSQPVNGVHTKRVTKRKLSEKDVRVIDESSLLDTMNQICIELNQLIDSSQDVSVDKSLSSRLLKLMISLLEYCCDVKGVSSLSLVENYPAVVKRELWNVIQKLNLQVSLDEDVEAVDEETKETADTDADADVFGDWYTMKTTASLGNELNELRNDPNFTGKESDVNQLISCIQSGNCDAVFDSLSRNLVAKSLKVKGKKKIVIEETETEMDIDKESPKVANGLASEVDDNVSEPEDANAKKVSTDKKKRKEEKKKKSKDKKKSKKVKKKK